MNKYIKHWPLLIVGVAYTCLVLMQLENHLLWQDEAETALLGQTILSEGIPKGTDGKNFFTQQQGAEYGEDMIWRYHPWLPMYLVAPSLALLGNTTLAARLPFALLSLLTLFLLYLLAFQRYKSVVPATAGVLFLVTSDFFLTLSGQARYLSPIVFLTMILLFLYWEFKEKQARVNCGYLLVLLLLFQTHYLTAGIVVLIFHLHALLFRRDVFVKLFLHTIGIIAIQLPYFIWVFGPARVIQLQESANILDQFATSFMYYGKGFFSYLTHPILWGSIILILAIRIFDTSRSRFFKSVGSPIGLYFIGFIVSLLLLSLISKENYLRYLSFFLAFSAFFAVQLTDALWRQKKYLAYIVLIALPLLSQVMDYYQRVRYEYTGPITHLVELFKAQTKPGDVIVASYGDLSLAYYLPNRIISAHRPEDWADIQYARFIVIRQNVNSEQEVALHDYVSGLLDETYRVGTLSHAPDLPYECRETPEYDVRAIIRQMPPLQVLMKVE